MYLFSESTLCVSLQHVLKFAEMTQEIQMSQPSATKLDFGLTPGRRKANQVACCCTPNIVIIKHFETAAHDTQEGSPSTTNVQHMSTWNCIL